MKKIIKNYLYQNGLNSLRTTEKWICMCHHHGLHKNKGEAKLAVVCSIEDSFSYYIYHKNRTK